MPSHTATGKQKQRRRQAGVQVASRTRQNLHSFFWLGSQRGSLHAHGLAASHREPASDGLCLPGASVPELPGQLASFWGTAEGISEDGDQVLKCPVGSGTVLWSVSLTKWKVQLKKFDLMNHLNKLILQCILESFRHLFLLVCSFGALTAPINIFLEEDYSPWKA